MFSSLEPFIAGSFTLLAFILLTNPKPVNTLGNRWLAVFLCLVGIMIFDKGLYEHQFYQTHVEWVGFTDIILLFLAPILYLSIKYFVSVTAVFDKKDFLHFLIPICALPFSIHFMLQNAAYKHQVLGSFTSTFSGINSFLCVQLIVYWCSSYYLLQKHQRAIQLFTASTDKINLNWLKYFLIGVAVMIAIFVAEYYFQTCWIFQYTAWGYFIIVYFLAYFARQQIEIFPFDTKNRAEIKEIIEENSPAQKQERLSQKQIEALKEVLTGLMRDEKLYLDETLSLPTLAQKMAISTHDLSYLLNQGYGDNFFQFINAYRVEEAKLLLLSDKYQHLNMVGIAYAVGFSSKTTFYTTFKKMTNQSPSEFQSTAKKN